MRVVLQRSREAKVEINNEVVGSIKKGLVVFVCFTEGDDIDTINKMLDKIINLRIFDDENKIMNKSLLEIKGKILSVSQFTLYADTTKGRRPSYTKALNYETANNLYQLFNKQLAKYVNVSTGIFGKDMQVSLINDGPITIILDM